MGHILVAEDIRVVQLIVVLIDDGVFLATWLEISYTSMIANLAWSEECSSEIIHTIGSQFIS